MGSKKKDCHERALGLLAVRPRARRELQQRLLMAKFDPDEVEEVLERLERVGLIDDRSFAQAFTQHQFQNRRSGKRVVIAGLMAKGISSDLAQEAVAEDVGSDAERADALAQARAPRLEGLEPKKAFDRLFGLLVRRGHSPDVARDAARRALGLDLSRY